MSTTLTRATLGAIAEAYLQDDVPKISHDVSTGDLGKAMDRAIERYSRDRPLKKYASASGDGSTYEFAVPTGWVEDVSELLEVHYPDPPASDQREPNLIYNANARNEPELVRVLKNASGVSKIRFMEDTPVTGSSNIRWVFTTTHTVHASTAASTTVYADDDNALGMLVASYAAEMVSSKYAESKDSAISVDSVDFRSKSREYADRARALLRHYQAHISGDSDQPPPPASGFMDWDSRLLGGRDRLIRRGRLS